MKKVVIVNCFDTYEDRIDLLHEFFSNKGHDVTVIQSDFRHFKKVHRTYKKQDFIFVESKPYYKNMSIDRLTSHYKYAKDAFKIVDKIKPDLLYVIIPPNSLAKFAAKYKRNNKDVKLIFDLIDLWPETMPVGKIKNLPPFTFWRMMRDNSLRYADFVIAECNLYRTILEKVLKRLKTETLYLAKRDIEINMNPTLFTDEINLCYLGSINNIIDISRIKSIIKSINELKPTTLHIIGDGESKDYLVNEIRSIGVTVEYYGKIYDSKKKQDVFDKCHFGLNIMKDNVCVGLTMKSIDYFQHGLPILNNIQADTSEIVESNQVGFNITEENIKEVAISVSSTNLEDFIEMRKNTKKVFMELFSLQAFNQSLEKIFYDSKVFSDKINSNEIEGKDYESI
jgi:hypothetical protein